MKKADENRYPHSADLFRFCKEALNIKHNFEVKVIDQHVGAMLGYDPADCSHWKKGKKNIKSLQAINSIAGQLDIDPRFIADIAAGRIDLEESIQDYKGYGPMQVSPKYYEDLKREYFKNPSKFALAGDSRSFDQVVDLQRNKILNYITQILEKADVKSCPVMIPEIAVTLENITLEASTSLPGDKLVTTTFDGQKYLVTYRKGEMKAHLRFLIARELGRVFLYPSLTDQENDELVCARINLFASLLLAPSSLLQLATRQCDSTRDLSGQLAEIFWVSRTVMNARLKDFFVHGN